MAINVIFSLDEIRKALESSPDIRKRYRLFDQHNGNVVFNRVKVSPVLTNKASVNRFLNAGPPPVAQLALFNEIVDFFDQFPTCQTDR